MKLLRYIALALLLSACAQEEKIVVTTESEILNEMLRQAPIQVIDLDETPVDTVYVETFIDFFSPELEREGVLIHNVVSLNHSRDYFYVITRFEPFITQFDRSGDFVEQIGRRGEGPNEYDFINNVTGNEYEFFITDAGNARIHVYDHSMVYQATLTVEGTELVHKFGHLPASNNIMLLKTDASNDKLVRVISTDSTYHGIDTFLPRLIPRGMQPMPVNDFSADISRSGTIALSYFGLPYIMLLNDSFGHEFTIALENQEFNIPSLRPVPDDGAGIGVWPNISAIKWVDDEHIMIVTYDVITIFSNSSDGYEVMGRYKLKHADSDRTEQQDDEVRIQVVDIDDDFVYVTNHFGERVSRFALSEIGL